MRNLHTLDQYRITIPGAGLGNAVAGAFDIPATGVTLRVIASAVLGWDHVSVSTKRRCPNWPEMSRIKEMFFEPDETAMQLHVPAAEHVNNHPYCLHLWRPHHGTIPRPPAAFVGSRDLSPDQVRALSPDQRRTIVADAYAEVAAAARAEEEGVADGGSGDRHRLAALGRIIRDTLWMARRYAHGRESYAVGMYNRAARAALSLGVGGDMVDGSIFAVDGSGRAEMSGLSTDELRGAIEGLNARGTTPVRHPRQGGSEVAV